MDADLVPLGEVLIVGDAKAKALHVPQWLMVLPGAVNIQRVGTKGAATNDFVCREEGCTWRKEGISIHSARKHSKAHGDRPCHIFEAVRRADVLEQYAAQSRAKGKRFRDRRKEEGGLEPRQKRLHGSGVASSAGQQPGVEEEKGGGDDDDDDDEEEDEDDYLPERNMFPVWLDKDTGAICGVVSLVRRPGHGAIHVPGRFRPGARDAVEVAVSWASTQVRPLWRWLGRPGKGESRRRPALLWRSTETLVVGFGTGHSGHIGGGSLGPAVALSLVSMLTRRPVKNTVAVTGLLDLSGNILHVSGLRAKLRACKNAEFETLLVPESSLADFSIQSLPEDLRDYAYRALRGVRTMTDVIRLSIQDCPPLPPDMTHVGLAPSGVGLGYALCYEPRLLEDSWRPIGRLVFEAVSRPCGSGKLVFTGSRQNHSLSRMAEMAFEWAMANQHDIVEELGRRPGVVVVSRNRDIHLHLRLGVEGMALPPFYCPAMGVALASLLSGRLPLEEVAVSGDLSVLDEYTGTLPALSQVEHVKLLYEQGFRRLVEGCERCLEPSVLGEVARRGIRVETPPEDDITFTTALRKVFGLVQ